MLKALDDFYKQQEEQTKSCLLALRKYILDTDVEITEAWKYRMPFFYYKGKMFCYLWTDKKTKQPYIGMVDGNKLTHPLLIQDKRARMKIFYIDSKKDLPIKTLHHIFELAIALR
ncbi:MAG: hypothetical protein JWO58_2298 [Chitinophagaceae bacterium]|nr:hypothetical protein [Chitinophagaceae bacterium]